MEEDKKIEISYNQLIAFQNALFSLTDKLGNISITGYTRDKMRKDTQKKIVEVYDTLFLLNKYLENIKRKYERELND